MPLHDRILLATDLSARSDRAMDRAIMLAKREGAEMVALHVLEPTPDNRFYPRTRPLSDLAAIARAQVCHDLGECADEVQVRIEDGDPAEVIERVVREHQSTLVVVGVARVERLGRFTLGKTVERLVRSVEAPLLIVTDRPRGPYRRVCVAVDFTPVSAEALRLTAALFPDQRITALHGYQPLAKYGLSDAEKHAAQFREMAERELEEWLDQAGISAEVRELVDKRIELGDPSRAIRDAAANHDFDLVVIGTRGRGRISELLVGSVAKQILAELPCDALFVRQSK